MVNVSKQEAIFQTRLTLIQSLLSFLSSVQVILRSSCFKARSHHPFLRIRVLLVPKNGSCEHIKNDLPSNGSLILKKPMEIEHALSSSNTLLER